MSGIYIALSLLAGAMLPLQAVVNARLAHAVGGPVWAASISALIVAIVLALIAIGAGKPLPGGALMEGLPWWAWIGGLCGAVVLAATATSAPKIGTGVMIALIMVGQVVAALALDRVNWFGMDARSLEARHLIAAIMLIGGALLMAVPHR